jgi:glutamine synthetase
MDNMDLLARIKEDGVKFISLQFTDVTGAVKSVDIPAHRISTAMEDGVWFDGSSVEVARIQERYAPGARSRHPYRAALDAAGSGGAYFAISTSRMVCRSQETSLYLKRMLQKVEQRVGFIMLAQSRNFSCSSRWRGVDTPSAA